MLPYLLRTAWGRKKETWFLEFRNAEEQILDVLWNGELVLPRIFRDSRIEAGQIEFELLFPKFPRVLRPETGEGEDAEVEHCVKIVSNIPVVMLQEV